MQHFGRPDPAARRRIPETQAHELNRISKANHTWISAKAYSENEIKETQKGQEQHHEEHEEPVQPKVINNVAS